MNPGRPVIPGADKIRADLVSAAATRDSRTAGTQNTPDRRAMSTLFTRIIEGELPGRFVWKDPDVVAFLSIGPLADGHVLVVPRAEVDKWTDASPELLAKVTLVAQTIGRAQMEAFGAPRAGVIIAGFEINHLHLHVWPSFSEAEYDFKKVQQNPDPAVMDAAAEKIREALRAAGHGENVPAA